MEFTHLSPILWTKNLEETISFYESIGFKSESNFPNFVSLEKDDIVIMFVVPQDEPEDCKDPNDKKEFFPYPAMTGGIYITTDQVDETWERVKNNAKVKVPIADRQYLMRDFSIFDNNGYELVFGQDISGKI